MKRLIEGAYDLHVHSAPDILPRKGNDMEFADHIISSGMAGFCLKSHYFCTAERASLVNFVNPQCDCIGALTLNSSVGGLNPAAVELAARAGAKVIWMPTCDSAYERAHVFASGMEGKLPFWARIITELEDENVRNPTISIIDAAGELSPETYEVFDVIQKHDIILATGHISSQETFALAREAKKRGFRKLVVTHVDFPSTFYTIEQQHELVGYGAIMEHCYTTYATGKVPFEETLRQIREIGPENVMLGSDLGQPNRPFPDEGILDFSVKLYDAGFSLDDVHMMNRENPKRLLGIA